ncbi:hypothetical protein [Microbulbifer halophilus]|uniref:hypothetical protein n=1 Tax=Microbulbifer halophilus TaxID=453963 RepID=UPI003609D94F
MIDEVQELLSEASNYNLSDVNVSPFLSEVRLNFSGGQSVQNFSLELYRVSFYRISKTAEDEEGCFLIGDLRLTKCRDGGLKCFGWVRVWN